MRISDVDKWATCERYALEASHAQHQFLRRRIHVAAMVGSLVHKLVTGAIDAHDEMEGWRSRSLTCDATTPDVHAALWQAQEISDKIRYQLATDGWTIIGTEEELETEGTTGRLDLIAHYEPTAERAVLDIKTGREIGTGWLQVGGYLNAVNASHTIPLELGGIIHAPRFRQGPYTAHIETRPAPELARAWRRRRTRIDDVLDRRDLPLESPGKHCRRCDIRDCTSRAE
ncbi:MAG: hypothetical protein F4Y26_05235 [Gammaproteobacteria bacterium]|nr:hypothetical protein [Gammaproteobacteria bacterium]